MVSCLSSYFHFVIFVEPPSNLLTKVKALEVNMNSSIVPQILITSPSPLQYIRKFCDFTLKFILNPITYSPSTSLPQSITPI